MLYCSFQKAVFHALFHAFLLAVMPTEGNLCQLCNVFGACWKGYLAKRAQRPSWNKKINLIFPGFSCGKQNPSNLKIAAMSYHYRHKQLLFFFIKSAIHYYLQHLQATHENILLFVWFKTSYELISVPVSCYD